MLLVARPLLRRLSDHFKARGTLTQGALAVILLVVLASAWTTEWLGIHALFGAFLAGAVMPKNSGFVKALTHRLEDVTVVLLLPLYFAFTGLRTSIGLISGADLWFYCALIILVAIIGKFGGGAGNGHDLARSERAGCANEYKRTSGVGGAQRRSGHWGALAYPICHDGLDGPGYYLYDLTFARAHLPGSPYPERNALTV